MSSIHELLLFGTFEGKRKEPEPTTESQRANTMLKQVKRLTGNKVASTNATVRNLYRRLERIQAQLTLIDDIYNQVLDLNETPEQLFRDSELILNETNAVYKEETLEQRTERLRAEIDKINEAIQDEMRLEGMMAEWAKEDRVLLKELMETIAIQEEMSKESLSALKQLEVNEASLITQLGHVNNAIEMQEDTMQKNQLFRDLYPNADIADTTKTDKARLDSLKKKKKDIEKEIDSVRVDIERAELKSPINAAENKITKLKSSMKMKRADIKELKRLAKEGVEPEKNEDLAKEAKKELRDMEEKMSELTQELMDAEQEFAEWVRERKEELKDEKKEKRKK